MATEVLNVTSEQNYWEFVRRAGEVLRSGGLVAFPTETVYGVASSAEDPDAVARLTEAKGRRDGGPFTVHIGRRSDAARFVNHTSGVGRRLIARGWPGPLTLIFDVAHPEAAPVAEDKDPGFVERVYFFDAGADCSTVGLRYPDCPPACDTINEAGCVIVASSANRAGQPSPTRACEVLDQLEVDLREKGRSRSRRQPEHEAARRVAVDYSRDVPVAGDMCRRARADAHADTYDRPTAEIFLDVVMD